MRWCQENLTIAVLMVYPRTPWYSWTTVKSGRKNITLHIFENRVAMVKVAHYEEFLQLPQCVQLYLAIYLAIILAFIKDFHLFAKTFSKSVNYKFVEFNSCVCWFVIIYMYLTLNCINRWHRLCQSWICIIMLVMYNSKYQIRCIYIVSVYRNILRFCTYSLRVFIIFLDTDLYHVRIQIETKRIS